jgi:membrane protease YdiL (CAAX protease family)
LGFHLAPGFENIPVLQQVVLKQDAAPFSLWLNFDKTAAGVLVAGFCYRRRRERALQIRRSLLSTILMACVIAACLLVPATICAYVRWNPSWNPLFLVWAPINLFLVCMSEEAFFRGFLQAEVVPELPAGAGPIIGVVLSGTLFGLAHIAGGWTYVTLAAAAGIGYATVFQFTRRLEYSILAHWMTNSIHFVLFTYPALAAAAPR